MAAKPSSSGQSSLGGRVVRKGGKWVALGFDRKKVLGTFETYREAVQKIKAPAKGKGGFVPFGKKK